MTDEQFADEVAYTAAVWDAREKQFRDLVRRCRAAQKAYFKSRSSDDLETSKRLEREIDRELESDGQRELFEEPKEMPI